MRPPDLGRAGTRAAWRVNRDRALQAGPLDWQASLAGWILECRGDAPFWAWSFWSISVVHLRPLPGVRPAQLQYDGAQYEIVSAAIDPEVADPVEACESGAGARFLSPLDFVIQFHGVDDAGAVSAAERCVEDSVRGMLSPDRFFKSAWKSVLASHGAKFSPRFEVNQVGHA